MSYCVLPSQPLVGDVCSVVHRKAWCLSYFVLIIQYLGEGCGVPNTVPRSLLRAA